jgi:predicted acetyltransferase
MVPRNWPKELIWTEYRAVPMDRLRADPTHDLIVRPATKGDLDRLLEIHLAAFPDTRTVEVRKRVFLQNRLGGFEHLRVAVRKAEVVGHAFAFPIAAWFGGVKVPGCAIASVGVALESRARGVASALLARIHDESLARGEAFTLLYPFRQGFYGRHGYAPVAPHRVLTVSPGSIPSEWSQAAPGTLRRARSEDRELLQEAYHAAARVGTGFIDRTPSVWERDLLDECTQWLTLDDDGRVSGYVALRLEQDEPHARVRAVVRELVAADDRVRRRLFAALASLYTQVAELTFTLADGDPLDWGLVDGDRDRGGTEEVEHAQGVVSTGPMLRLNDARAALLARGYNADGSIDIALGEDAPFGLRVDSGRASVGGAAGGPVLRATTKALASILYGGLTVAQAARLGWAEVDGEIERTSLLLAVPPFLSLDTF